MLSTKRSYSSKTSFIDFLLNSSMTIFVLFFLTILLANPNKKQSEGIQHKAEVMITAEWDSKSDCDVDLWVQDPTGAKSFFLNKDVGLMHLERDDLGKRSDTVAVGNQVYTVDENKEYTILRGLLPGRYTVNVHLYTCIFDGAYVQTGQAKQPIPVKVQLQKLNPHIRLYQDKQVVLNKVWEEQTAFSFNIDANGIIGNIEYHQKSLVKVLRDGAGIP